ncbi:MAG: BamA/TamA family outer membrane protein [Runella sp.]
MKIIYWVWGVMIGLELKGAVAQNVDSLQQDQKEAKKITIIPAPVLYYTPETRWAYGIAATSAFRFKGDSANARPSQVSLSAVYTQERQYLFYSQFQLFPHNAKYFFYGEMGYFRYAYNFFGIGEEEVPKEQFVADYPRIRLNFMQKISPSMYGGFRYQFEDFKLIKTQPNGVLTSGDIPGTPRSVSSGFGLGLLYDTRDKVFFPTKGIFADLAFLHFTPTLGSHFRFDRFSADISAYQKLAPKVVLAGNLFSSFTLGSPPFNMMSELGGGRRLRGYYLAHFRDDHALLLQSELRFGIFRRLGGVVFGSSGILGSQGTGFRFNEPRSSYGAGLRFTANRREHLNVRFDYAMGKDISNFYFTIGEAF